ncbi:MAG: A24 family peptidase [Angelakisella sp.]
MDVIIQAILHSALLIYVAIKDVQTREISPYLCLGVACLSLFHFQAENLLGLGIAMIVYVCAVWICPEQLGGGDMKLIASVSVVLGFTATAYGLIIAFILELIKFQMIRRKLQKQEAGQDGLPLAPFLTVGFLITYFMKLGGLIL